MTMDPKAPAVDAQSAEYDEDVGAEKPDPKEAYAAFEDRHALWLASPSDLTWHEFRRAFRQVWLSLSASEQDELWKAKHQPGMTALLDFGREQDRRYATSPQRKRSKAKYDSRNAQTERRKEQCRKARATYNAKQRDLKKGGKS